MPLSEAKSPPSLPPPLPKTKSLVLGIDTSCDDTGIGIVGGGKVIANAVASQAALHASFGGVVPESASREHLAVIDEVLSRALDEAGATLEELGAVAATYGPGLVGALLVGLSFGKTLAWGLGLPFLPVHHLEGHIAAAIAGGDVTPPFLCLVASGGHTSLFDVREWGEYRELGRTRDDAAGEAFDKVARLLGLPYPGGPQLANLAREGDRGAYRFTPPLRRQEGFDFSFSGLKTAVATLLEREPRAEPKDVAASFEHTVVESLVATAIRAANANGRQTLVVAGGVAANLRLRERLRESGLTVSLPPQDLATDNGAMIALAGEARLSRGLAGDRWDVDARPYLPLSSNAAR
ncbi:MAG: tRNA (adenosine(37)-N6)-threonylcarbamoyltransferase complex transferase subunit TsaD [Trueperaceae bacterium]